MQLAASTGNPDFIVPAGALYDATADTGGVYSLVLNEWFPVFVGGFGVVMQEAVGSTADVYRVNIAPGDYDPTTGTLEVTLLTDDGDGTETAENGQADDWVYFELTFCRRSQLAPSGAL